MRELIAKPLGLVTQPNQVGLFAAGAMRRADGLRMRNPGELEPFKVNSQYAPGAGSGTYFVQRLFSTGSQVLVFKNGTPYLTNSAFEIYWATGAGQTVAPHESPTPTYFSSRIIPQLFRGRTLVNTQKGVSVADYANPTTTDERTFRHAGLPQPMITAFSRYIPPSEGQNPLTVVSIACVFKRTYSDGYEIISAPSAIVRTRNGHTTDIADIVVGIGKPQSAVLRAGDVIEVYRSREVAAPTAGLDVDSGTTLYQCASHTLTAADLLGSTFAVIVTAKANEIVGKELYTNPGQESLQSSRNLPPVCKSISTYKGYVFYSNTQQPGIFEARFPGGVGRLGATATALERARGVGARRFLTGTFTSGNPTITGISSAEMVGVVVGQVLTDGGVRIPGTSLTLEASMTRIVSKTATSITMSANALSSGGPSPDFESFDVVEIDGVLEPFPDVQGLVASLMTSPGARYSVTTDTTIPYRDGFANEFSTSYGSQIAIRPARFTIGNGSIAVRGTNGANYMPPIPELAETAQTFAADVKPNFTWWTWEQQPECVPPGNYVPVLAGEIDAVVTTRDAQWFWCSDGLTRWTGYGTRPSGIQANWRYDLIDARIRLASPTSYCVMNDEIFAYTNQGFVRVSDSRGIEYLSRGVIGDLIPGATWAETLSYSMAADPILNEVWLNITTPFLSPGDRSLTIVWNNIYSVFTVLNQRIGDDDNTYLTALEFAAQAGVVLLGVTRFSGGSGSGMIDWHDPAGNTYMAWTADFQPLYGPDPMSSKQWVDLTVIFDSASAPKSITPRFNEIAGSYTNPTVLYPQTKDSRVSFGVPQTAPAIAALLVPGMSGAQVTGITRLRAISPRFSVFNEQQLVR